MLLRGDRALPHGGPVGDVIGGVSPAQLAGFALVVVGFALIRRG